MHIEISDPFIAIDNDFAQLSIKVNDVTYVVTFPKIITVRNRDELAHNLADTFRSIVRDVSSCTESKIRGDIKKALGI